MAEKLRRKFILVSVGAVSIVVFTIALFSNLINYTQILNHSDELLVLLAENDGHFPMKEEPSKEYQLPPKISPETPFSTRFFTVRLDNNRNVVETDTGKIASISTTEAFQYANKALQKGKSSHFIDHYRYLIVDQGDRSLIIFMDVERELEMFYTFLKNSLLICLIGTLAVFILVSLFSKRAIRPIVESYEKQKQFITDASHELKTPLAIINTNTEVLEMEYGESQWTKSTQNQITRLSGLVESLITLTRMDEEKMELLKTEFSLSDLIIKIAEQFKEWGNNQNKNLHLEVEDSISYYGNEESFSQLITILIDNAFKYSPKDSEIIISLKKQGKGIIFQTINQADHLSIGNYEQLFERFYRLDQSRNSQIGGQGIGLSIAQAIVKQHKGKIKAESPDGKTMVLTVQL